MTPKAHELNHGCWVTLWGDCVNVKRLVSEGGLWVFGSYVFKGLLNAGLLFPDSMVRRWVVLSCYILITMVYYIIRSPQQWQWLGPPKLWAGTNLKFVNFMISE